MLGSNYWLYQSASKIFAVASATHTDITILTGLTPVTKPSQWSHTLLNGIPIMNNSVNIPQYWLGNVGVKTVAIPGWPANTLADFITSYKYHLFAFGISVLGVRNDNLFLWSDAAAPGTIPQFWTPSATNEAGSGQLSDTPSVITTARTLRDSLVIYKRNAAYTVDYVKGNDKFVVKGLWSRTGALSPRAVDDCNGWHAVVTQGDIVRNDGFNQPVSFGDALVNNFLFNQLSGSTFEALQVLYDHTNRDVWICFPEQGATYCTLALVYNIPSNAWGVVELADVAYTAMGIIDDAIPGTTYDTTTLVYDTTSLAYNESSLSQAVETMMQSQPNQTRFIAFNTSDLTVVNSLVAKYSMPFGEPERIKFVRQLHLRGRNFGTFYVRVGYQMFTDDPISWSTEYAVTDPNQPVPTFTQGRYISVEIRSADNKFWELNGVDFEVEMRGYY
jgi:hypothetical protein